MNVTINNQINTNYNTSVLLVSNLDLKKKKLKTIINKFIILDSKYNKILEDIEKKLIKNNSIESLLTIADFNETSSGKLINRVHQLLIMGIKLENIKDKDNRNNLEQYRLVGYKIQKGMHKNLIDSVNVLMLDKKNVEALTEGFLLSNYKFDKYKSKNETKANKNSNSNNNNNPVSKNMIKLKNLHIVLQNELKGKDLDMKKLLGDLGIRVDSVFMSRDLSNEPSNKLTPEIFVKTVLSTIKKYKLPIETEIISGNKLVKNNLNLIYSVGKYSKGKSNARLLICKYVPNRSDDILLSLVGKGVTYDTGGLSLKIDPSQYVFNKMDMAGASLVISFLIGYARMKGNKNVMALCPLAENNIGTHTTKPGDIIESYNGKTVEIINTDAEGRLMLADTIAYISDKYPKSQIIEFSTLTQSQDDLSCKHFSNIMGINSDSLIKKMINIGGKINERLVSLPVMREYIRYLKSNIADVKNEPTKCGSDLFISMCFLLEFVKKNTKFIHIDIAGTVYDMKEIASYMGDESSGIGVRLLFELIKTF
tara:strand:- start:240 stop:1850 length:1611 start_codon:yes stop_codon:yes gene_type:complete